MSQHSRSTETSNPEVRTLTAPDAIAYLRRHRILRCLRDGDGTAAVDDLATTLTDDDRYSRPKTAGESGPDGETAKASTDERTIRIRLHHVDLPALADAGFIEYDRERRRVRCTAE